MNNLQKIEYISDWIKNYVYKMNKLDQKYGVGEVQGRSAPDNKNFHNKSSKE